MMERRVSLVHERNQMCSYRMLDSSDRKTWRRRKSRRPTLQPNPALMGKQSGDRLASRSDCVDLPDYIAMSRMQSARVRTASRKRLRRKAAKPANPKKSYRWWVPKSAIEWLFLD